MHLVQQRLSRDCVIAAMAMFTGLSYEEIYAVAKGHWMKGRRGISQSSAILRKLGYRQDNYAYGPTETPGTGREFRSLWLYDYYLSPNILRDYIWGREAMISVESLNERGGKHMVYYDGHRIWDPQDGRRGKRCYREMTKEVMPTEAFVWRTP